MESQTSRPVCIENMLQYVEGHYSEYELPRYIKMTDFPELGMEDEVTIFLPAHDVMMQAVPMDISDPFFIDQDLREKALKSFIVKGRHVIGPNKTFNSISGIHLNLGEDGKTLGEQCEIVEKNPQGYNNSKGDLYIVNGLVGITHDEISESIQKYPQESAFD